jgi:hypothetical protein
MKTSDPRQDELPLSSLDVTNIFAGRAMIQVREAAKVLGCTENHIYDLIDEYRLTGGQGGLEAVNISSGKLSPSLPTGNKGERPCLRVVTKGLQKFIDARTVSNAAAAPSPKS